MEKSKNKTRFIILAVMLILIFCFAITPKTFQNDTYYTIKIGEHIVNNGIDMKDPFSWHKGLDYTYPHWLYDLLTYLIYSVSGFEGIYIVTLVLTMALGITIFITNNKLTKNSLISFILTIGILYMIKDFIAARAQLVTFILFVLTVYFIEMFLDTKKKRYAIGLVIIPILIANLHCAVFPFYFVLYLPYIAEYLSYYIYNSSTYINKVLIKIQQKRILKAENNDEIEKIKDKLFELQKKQKRIDLKQQESQENEYKVKIVKNDNIKYLIIIMVICLLTGLLTPLRLTPYTYLVNTMLGNTTQNINEHLPLVLAENINMAIAMLIFIAILTFTDIKIRLKDLFMLFGLIILAFYSKRQETIFAIIACGFILNRMLCEFFSKHKANFCIKFENKITSILGSVITIIIVLSISIFIYKPKLDDEFIDKKSYPIKAADYILENLDVNNIRLYNEYNYGSYLLFRNIPVFVDSRADLYSPEFNKGTDVFTDFININNLHTNDIENKFDYYGITHLILQKNSKLRKVISKDNGKYKLLYEDEYFYIYERKTLTLNIDVI